jgi:polyisoprenoid-binding protein YceI
MIHLISRLMIAALACLVLANTAVARDWSVEREQSALRFAATAQGEEFEGRFQRFSASIRFDPADLDSSRFEVDIALASVDSMNSERDEMLAEPEFFDTRRQPTATYRAERFEALADGRFRADGTLSLRGVPQPVPLDFTWTETGGSAVLEGSATLDRLAFGVGSGEWADTDAIAAQVQVRTRLQLNAAD